MIFSERKKILAIFLYMVVGSAVSVFVIVLLMSLLMDIYLYIDKGIVIDVYLYDFNKLFKVSLFCGLIGGGGCWSLYYRNYRKNK